MFLIAYKHGPKKQNELTFILCAERKPINPIHVLYFPKFTDDQIPNTPRVIKSAK